MKCPGCDYVCSELRDICPRCLVNLRSHKRLLGLPVIKPDATYSELRGKVSVAKKSTAPGIVKSFFSGVKGKLFGSSKQQQPAAVQQVKKAQVPLPPESARVSEPTPTGIPATKSELRIKKETEIEVKAEKEIKVEPEAPPQRISTWFGPGDAAMSDEKLPADPLTSEPGQANDPFELVDQNPQKSETEETPIVDDLDDDLNNLSALLKAADEFSPDTDSTVTPVERNLFDNPILTPESSWQSESDEINFVTAESDAAHSPAFPPVTIALVQDDHSIGSSVPLPPEAAPQMESVAPDSSLEEAADTSAISESCRVTETHRSQADTQEDMQEISPAASGEAGTDSKEELATVWTSIPTSQAPEVPLEVAPEGDAPILPSESVPERPDIDYSMVAFEDIDTLESFAAEVTQASSITEVETNPHANDFGELVAQALEHEEPEKTPPSEEASHDIDIVFEVVSDDSETLANASEESLQSLDATSEMDAGTDITSLVDLHYSNQTAHDAQINRQTVVEYDLDLSDDSVEQDEFEELFNTSSEAEIVELDETESDEFVDDDGDEFSESALLHIGSLEESSENAEAPMALIEETSSASARPADQDVAGELASIEIVPAPDILEAGNSPAFSESPLEDRIAAPQFEPAAESPLLTPAVEEGGNTGPRPENAFEPVVDMPNAGPSTFDSEGKSETPILEYRTSDDHGDFETSREAKVGEPATLNGNETTAVRTEQDAPLDSSVGEVVPEETAPVTRSDEPPSHYDDLTSNSGIIVEVPNQASRFDDEGTFFNFAIGEFTFGEASDYSIGDATSAHLEDRPIDVTDSLRDTQPSAPDMHLAEESSKEPGVDDSLPSGEGHLPVNDSSSEFQDAAIPLPHIESESAENSAVNSSDQPSLFAESGSLDTDFPLHETDSAADSSIGEEAQMREIAKAELIESPLEDASGNVSEPPPAVEEDVVADQRAGESSTEEQIDRPEPQIFAPMEIPTTILITNCVIPVPNYATGAAYLWPIEESLETTAPEEPASEPLVQATAAENALSGPEPAEDVVASSASHDLDSNEKNGAGPFVSQSFEESGLADSVSERQIATSTSSFEEIAPTLRARTTDHSFDCNEIAALMETARNSFTASSDVQEIDLQSATIFAEKDKQRILLLFSLANESLELGGEVQQYIDEVQTSENREIENAALVEQLGKIEQHIELAVTKGVLKGHAGRPRDEQETISHKAPLQFHSLEPATRSRRIVAFGVDLLLVTIATASGALYFDTPESRESLWALVTSGSQTASLSPLLALALSFAPLAYIVLSCFSSVLLTTPGTWIAGLRLLTSNGHKPGLLNLFVRNMILPVSVLLFGWLPLLWRKAPLHDRMARTRLLR